jgi:glycosyltransferase involved in cell wall biosynthesis
VSAHSAIGRLRGEAVVCVAPGADRDQLLRCLRSVAEHTAPEIPILVCGHEAPSSRALGLDEPRQIDARELDFTGVAAASAPADLVWLSGDRVVCDGWLARLRAAAYLDSQVATATALTNRDSPATVSLPPGMGPDEAATAVKSGSARIRPRLVAAGRHCVYIRRSALELTAGFADLGDFSNRCVAAGLNHVLADDVLVATHDAVRLDSDAPAHPTAPPDPETGRRPVARPDPDARASSWLARADSVRWPTPLARSLGAVRRALHGISVAIDARVLSGPMNGTKLHVLELVAAVARAGELRVTALVGAGLDPATRELLASVPGLELLDPASADCRRWPRADLVHRPYQVDSPADLALLAGLGDRLLVTQQDLIAYDNPSYFRSSADWQAYRELTRSALAGADRVLFPSAYARDQALAEDLIERQRASVVPIGVDHPLTRARADGTVAPPPAADLLAAGGELILCIGSDYHHKNRLFALRLASELQRRHGWRGTLALAGSHVPFGSSHADEARLLEQDPRLRAAVVDLGPIGEPEKRWLLSHARLVVYPSVYEGFGLVPFEAADHDVPCMWAAGGAISELLPDRAAGIVPWDVAASAEVALRLLRDERERSQNVGAVRGAAASLRWDRSAKLLLEVYALACREPPTPGAAEERAGGVMQAGLSEDAVRLVGPGGALPRELERPLLALAARPRMAAAVLGAIKGGYELSRRWSARRSRGQPR